MTSLGLAAFVAMTGLHAGPIFVSALKEAGIGLFFGGIIVTTTPMVVGLYFGRYVLKMNPILLLGGLAGSMTMTAVQVRSNSLVAVLGYTPAVPLAHILLTTWGTVIVGIIAGLRRPSAVCSRLSACGFHVGESVIIPCFQQMSGNAPGLFLLRS
jgi:putative transport protein